MNRPKFVQIAGAGDILYALDDNGQVWQYNPLRQGNPNTPSWSQVDMRTVQEIRDAAEQRR